MKLLKEIEHVDNKYLTKMMASRNLMILKKLKWYKKQTHRQRLPIGNQKIVKIEKLIAKSNTVLQPINKAAQNTKNKIKNAINLAISQINIPHDTRGIRDMHIDWVDQASGWIFGIDF